MTLLQTICDALALIAAAVGVICWLRGRQRVLGRESGLALAALLLLPVVKNGLEYAARTMAVGGPAVAHLEGFFPLLWGFFFYSFVQDIAQEQLRQTEQEKAVILDSMSGVVLYQNPRMDILWANRAAAKSAGVLPEQLVGKKCYAVWHGREEPCESCPVLEARQSGLPQEAELTTPDKTTWSVAGYPVKRSNGQVVGVVEVAEDITEKKRAQEEHGQLAAIVTASADGIIGISVEGTVRSWNPGAEDMFGHRADQIVGRPIRELVPTESRDTLDHIVARVADGETIQRYEMAALARSGRSIYVSFTFCPIFDESRAVNGISVIARDVTGQVQLRDELRMLSLVDTLTGLNNRRGFFHLGAQQLKIGTRRHEPALLVFADLDGMKSINDTLGHKEGDRALIDAALVLRQTFRESDIIGRIGGDEFAVLAIDTGLELRDDVLARLQRNAANMNRATDRPYEVSFSVGVASYSPGLHTSLDELLSEADAQMYEQKRAKSGSRVARGGKRTTDGPAA